MAPPLQLNITIYNIIIQYGGFALLLTANVNRENNIIILYYIIYMFGSGDGRVGTKNVSWCLIATTGPAIIIIII